MWTSANGANLASGPSYLGRYRQKPNLSHSDNRLFLYSYFLQRLTGDAPPPATLGGYRDIGRETTPRPVLVIRRHQSID
jgi:hypothetical protein